MKKQILSALLAILACTQISHAMQQAAHSAGRNIRNGIRRRVSVGPKGELRAEEYQKPTGPNALTRCARQHGIEQCVEETWMPGLLPALLKLVEQPKSSALFHELQEEYKASQAGQ